MTVTQRESLRYVERPAPSSLDDVVDTILDKGMVVDFYARVGLLGLEVLYADGRIVMGSIDTYLRLARKVEQMETSGPVLLMT